MAFDDMFDDGQAQPGSPSGAAATRVCAIEPTGQMRDVIGVDAFAGDPISTFALQSEDFLRLGERLGQLGIPALFCLEGGYAVEPIGNYGIKPVFSDGHASGIFTWDYLYQLGAEQDPMWQAYLQRLAAAGVQRDDPMPVAAGAGCASH